MKITSRDIVGQIIDKLNLILAELKAVRREFAKHHKKYLRNKRYESSLPSPF